MCSNDIDYPLPPFVKADHKRNMGRALLADHMNNPSEHLACALAKTSVESVARFNRRTKKLVGFRTEGSSSRSQGPRYGRSVPRLRRSRSYSPTRRTRQTRSSTRVGAAVSTRTISRYHARYHGFASAGWSCEPVRVADVRAATHQIVPIHDEATEETRFTAKRVRQLGQLSMFSTKPPIMC